MTVLVLRLQGLNTEAGSEDIRRFFHGLQIPEGGVHIIGGENGEAFIMFETERDGQLAMRLTGKALKGSTISLHISSIAELKKKMESRLNRTKFTRGSPGEPRTAPSTSTDSSAALLFSLMTAIHNVSSIKQNSQMHKIPEESKIATNEPHYNQTPSYIQDGVSDGTVSVKQTDNKESANFDKPGFLRLYGFPESISKQEVFQFLRGLPVLEVITNVRLQLGWCCLVKLASFTDAEEGLKYSHRKFKEFNVEVRLAHEKMWTNTIEGSKTSPQILKPHMVKEQNEVNCDGHQMRGFTKKRTTDEELFPTSQKRHFRGFYEKEYSIIVNNLSKNITKTEIKKIFGRPGIPNYMIKHLLNKCGERTSSAFVTFDNPEDHALALKLTGITVGLKDIEVLNISKSEIAAIINENRCTKVKRMLLCKKTQLSMVCIYARNFPADVKKEEVKDFFSLYSLCENAIFLLVDSSGNCGGEAVVQFESAQVAKQAQKLHGKYFKGAKILLTCITLEQMQKIIGTQ